VIPARFDPSVLANDLVRRTTVLQILEGALAEVEPDRAVHRAMNYRDGSLEVAGVRLQTADVRRVMVLAFGKAAPAMARAAVDELHGLDVKGLVISNHTEPVPDSLELRVTGHPLPDDRSVVAAQAALDLLHEAGENDIVLCLISGGGSALLELPVTGLTLSDVQATVSALLAAGADIHELNTVRKHLSAIKGGRLAQAAEPAWLLTLILSDVVGNPLDVIASGPSVPDPTTYGDALAVLDRYDLRFRVPTSIIDYLNSRRGVTVDETPKTPYIRQSVSIVGDGATAAEGAATAARRAGWPAVIATTTMTGDARSEAVRCLEEAAEHGVTIFAGETTVKVTGTGRGGRNQEAALAAAQQLAGDSTTLFASLGTDGIDGPTEAAGAIVDGNTISRGSKLGLDAHRALAANDSGTYLEATGELLITGPTGTNVGDVWVVVRDLDDRRPIQPDHARNAFG
jgi:hydroxypyruvate reductase